MKRKALSKSLNRIFLLFPYFKALYSLIMVNCNLGWKHYNTMHFNAVPLNYCNCNVVSLRHHDVTSLKPPIEKSCVRHWYCLWLVLAADEQFFRF